MNRPAISRPPADSPAPPRTTCALSRCWPTAARCSATASSAHGRSRPCPATRSGELFQSKGKQPGWGFGYGVAVVLDPAAANSARGQGAFGWGRAFGTTTWTDLAREITAVLMVQQGSGRVLHDFKHAISTAIVD